MRYLITLILFLFLLTNAVFAESSGQRKPVIIDYSLKLFFDKNLQKVIVRLHNKSDINLKVRRDFSPFFLFPTGIYYFAVNESKDLDLIQQVIQMGHDPSLITIPAHEYYSNELGLDGFIINYCSILSKNSILIFWNYYLNEDNYTLRPTEGVFRVRKTDVKCDSN